MVSVIQALYLLAFRNITQRRTREYFSNLAEQLTSQIDQERRNLEAISAKVSYSGGIQRYMAEPDPAVRYDQDRLILENLKFVLSSNPSIVSIRVISRLGRVISPDTGFWDDSLTTYRIVQAYVEEGREVPNWFYTESWFNPKERKAYYALVNPIYPLAPDSSSRDTIGISILICSTGTIEKLIDNSVFSPNLACLLADGKGTVLASNRKDLQGRSLADLVGAAGAACGSVSTTRFDGRRMFVEEFPIERAGWVLVLAIPPRELTREMSIVLNSGILLELVVAFVLVAVGVVMVRGITRPIAGMAKEMEAIGTRQPSRRLAAMGRNEIGVLAHEVNTMLDRLEGAGRRVLETQEALHRAEIAAKEAQLSALQSQINPHFLFNTLECMRSIGLLHGVEEIPLVSSALARILRYSIREDDMVAVREEIGCITDYFSIISVRFEGKIRLETQVDPAILPKRIIKMILQPIVENAVYYGLEARKAGGLLSLRSSFDASGDIAFVISDNGKGMERGILTELRTRLGGEEREAAAQNTERRGIGLANIASRLRLKYGGGYGLTVESVLDQGTCVTVRVPAVD
jgi:two-component system sensor histidine kinase YesM